jgi:hypothetical protein
MERGNKKQKKGTEEKEDEPPPLQFKKLYEKLGSFYSPHVLRYGELEECG